MRADLSVLIFDRSFVINSQKSEILVHYVTKYAHAFLVHDT